MPGAEERRGEKTGRMSVEEAGRRGGETTRETHGCEFYREIGRKGGTAPRGAAARGEVPQKGELS
ncbi:MAG: hypothetical protein OIN66_06170 [Candidatus Methanoperedens sp.]|nr:hypothetical protein [Candidatus Methanoperedens sp.]